MNLKQKGGKKLTELKKSIVKEKVLIEIEPESEGLEFQKNIRKLYLYQFFMNFMLITGILIPFFLTWGGLTFVEVMYLESLFTIMIFVFEIPCGAISDYFSRRFSLILAGITGSIGAIVYTIYPSIYIFALGETIFAFTVALISGTDQAITYDTLKKMGKKEDLSKILARANIYCLVGLMISAPLGSLLALVLPLPMIFTLISVPLILGALVAFTLKEPNHDLEKESQNYLKIVKSGLNELRKNKALRALTFDSVTIEVFTFFMIWTYQLYLEDLKVPIIFYGFVAAGLALIQMVFSHYITKWEQKIEDKKRFLLVYSLIPGVAYLLIAMITSLPIGLMLILLIVGFGFSRRFLFVKAINELIETENRATVLSTVSMFSSLIRAGVYPLIGYCVMWDLKIGFIILGALIIGFALLSRIKNKYL
jgi:MFS family permease